MGCSHHLAPIAESNSPCCCGLPGLHFGLIGGMHSIPMIVVYIAKLPTKAQWHWRSLPALQQCMVASNGCRQKWDMLQLPDQAFLQGNRQKSNNLGEKSLYFCAVASSGRNQPQPSKAFTQHSSCLCDPSYFILLHSLLPGAHRRVPCPSPYYPLSITGELFLLGEEH